MKKILPIIIILGIILITGSLSVKAQEARTITVVPPTVEQTLNPGGRAEGILKVINQTNAPITFKATVQDYTVDNNDGVPHLLPPGTLSGKFSGSSWIGIYPDTFTIAPQQKQQINYYIQTPPNARPGGHYAAVIYTPQTSTSDQGSGASINGEIGSLFYITINGPITENAGVTKFLANGFQEFGPVNIQTQIKNNGDLHIKPIGAIVLSDIFGRKVQISNLQGDNIFPGGVTRDYQNQVGSKFMIGPYTARLLASYGLNNNLPLAATVSFFIFPWRIFVLIILIIIAIVLGALYIRKREKMKANKEKEPQAPPPASRPS